MLHRPAEGFLGGLWEYPGYTLKESSPEYFKEFCKKNKILIREEFSGSAKHTYSHFHQELRIYKAELNGEWQNSDWTESRFVDKNEKNKLARSKITMKISQIIHHQ